MRARIISLGEIVSPNILKSINAFTMLITGKKSLSNQAEIGRAIGNVLQSSMHLINDFKLGNISENDFDSRMIFALQQATGITLSLDEFNHSWNAMHPNYSQFSEQLNEAIAFNQRPGQKIIFISYTNPKDIRHLVEQLKINAIAHKSENENLTEIAGIKLLTTYAFRKSKAELIELANKELRSNPATQASLAYSINSAININNNSSFESPDIKYVRGINDIKDPILVLKDDLDKTNQEVEELASSLSIDTILWKKFEKQSLSDVLDDTQKASKMVSVSML